MSSDSLRITEIFFSLQGETTLAGLPTVFIRLTGCPLRCVYCDTAYAFQGGKLMTILDIVSEVESFPTRYVTVTGGEPLAQKQCITLLSLLCDKGYNVSLETSGAMPVADVDPRVIKIVDLKTPDSGECEKNDYTNIDYLLNHDQVKFVITSRSDYDWARFKIDALNLHNRVSEILFSPSHGQLEGRQLAEWILQDGLMVRYQQQLHKYLWNDEPGH